MAMDHMFTFGPEHAPVPDAVVTISGASYDEARAIMIALYGNQWSTQYSGDEILQYRYRYKTQCIRDVTIRMPHHGPH